jgi:Tfp pilus assembly protein PilF
MFLKAHALDENQFEVVIQLGRLYLEMKDLEMARKYLEKAAEMDVESGPAHRFLGECYNELNMVNEAVWPIQKLSNSMPMTLILFPPWLAYMPGRK